MMILLIGVYTYYSFHVFRLKTRKQQGRTFAVLTALLFLMHFFGYFSLFFQKPELKLIYLYLGELVLLILVLTLYQYIYPKLSKPLLLNMQMLLVIGFIIQVRLSYDKAVRQAVIYACSFLLCLAVPSIMKSWDTLKCFGWIYTGAGIALLLIVQVIGITSNGATNWLNIAGITIQPSEFVKLLYVFGIASLLKEGTSFRRVCMITALAGLTVIILVLQRDLGGALIFFVTYVFMLYAATMRPLYLFSGLLGGSLAAVVAYRLFNHVQVRVLAWKNPFAYIDREGYQITQSLFAIGTGGWFGMGLNRGLPTDIPVVDSDFIFSAISEELGGLFAICVILIYTSCFIMFFNIALKQEDVFLRLLPIGFAVMFGFQVFLSIGGVIKFIPSTGVTLPLVSRGGSSALSVVIMFMVLQGVHLAGKDRSRESKAEARSEFSAAKLTQETVSPEYQNMQPEAEAVPPQAVDTRLDAEILHQEVGGIKPETEKLRQESMQLQQETEIQLPKIGATEPEYRQNSEDNQ
jgi:peptidoglycan glycosyltransferase